MTSLPNAAIRSAFLGVALLLTMTFEARAFQDKSAADVAAELANPLAPITTLAGNFRAEMGNGPLDETNYQVRLQPSFFKPFAEKSALLVRTILPVRFNNWPVSANGLGDISIVPYYVPNMTAKTFIGYGGALIMPTATQESLGTGKWAGGPAVILARPGKPVTWGGLVQHAWSFAGASDRMGVSVTTMQPFVTYLLPAGWAANVTAETTCNWKGSDGNKWIVPLTFGISKVVRFGDKFVNLGFAYVNYVERPDFTTKSEIRLNATYVLR
jgi:hypothetical protein